MLQSLKKTLKLLRIHFYLLFKDAFLFLLTLPVVVNIAKTKKKKNNNVKIYKNHTNVVTGLHVERLGDENRLGKCDSRRLGERCGSGRHVNARPGTTR